MSWYVLDTETAGDVSTSFRLGVLMDERGQYKTFRDVEAMRQAVEACRGAVVWGHNVSYDLLVLWRGAVGAYFVSGRFRRAAWRGVHFRDTLSFFELPLADAALLVGHRKLEGDARAMNGATLEERCVTDCLATRALVQAIHEFAGSARLSPVATGPGSWARAYWKHSAPWIEGYPDDLKLDFPVGLMRGGLVKHEAREVGAGEKWDVKSAYPWQMLAGKFPDLRSVSYATRGGLPVLVRYRTPTALVWGPPEEAEALGVRVLPAALRAPRGAWGAGSPFEAFVHGLMGLRNAYKARRDAAGDYLAKRVLNSLSGCLGARTAPLFVRGGIASGGKRLRALPGTRSVWAALVTGRQRARLLRAWKLARDPVYSDTDSLVCKAFGGDGEGTDECGRWVLEETFDSAVVLGPKMYGTIKGGEVSSAHVKGIPRRMAADAIGRFRKGGETVLVWDSVATYREAPNLPGLWLRRRRDPFAALRREGK